MGDPKRIRSKYDTPVHPWQKERLETEKSLVQKYGLVNKKEVYKANSRLKKYKDLAKSLVAKQGDQAEVEKNHLFSKLKSLNLIQEDSLDNVLGLSTEQLLDRRLQTVIVKLGLARSVKQARQMIVHKHVSVNGKKITSPSYLVNVSEEGNITFHSSSAFVDEEHPERKLPEVSKEASKEDSSDKKETKAPKEESKSEEVKEAPKEEKPAKESEAKSEEPKKEKAKEAEDTKEEPKKAGAESEEVKEAPKEETKAADEKKEQAEDAEEVKK